ncbi:GuaB3 family IMP dehydrogenase-related protein [Gordonia sp. PDNC005]|uniref:GuaB3 family IMP dehydrogenase-related protein n=1 Tax=unclassified Gordonia (in: high G+C Gram-positive bacteria) TaxID=2657482 RepID=UPI001964C30F|nr:GuaB3 family IMP dehydrogenase-related protein [Gordonia sp. PDNC005]QRY63400.1 GuaB3 family IMP dehydrogenase-related protein [Gordonia sp. PDNC005]
MRDLVEFGMGRTARRTYELEDISIVPSRRTRSSKNVSTAWQIDAYRFGAPILNHPTDALGSPEAAIEMGRLGALGVLDGEGLWARHENVEEKIAELVDIAENNPDPAAAVRHLQKLHSAPISDDLLSAAVRRVRDAGVTTAVRVSPQHAAELAPTVIAAGAEILVVHGTIISAEHVVLVDRGDDELVAEPLNLKTFISDLDIPVIAGGVHDHRTALHLMRTGAAGVIVGYGSAEGATTTGEVLGIGVPMATAIADAAAARRDYLDETGGRYVHVIADGDIHTSGDLAKAIACGADAAVLGTPLAAASSAPGKGWYWPSAAAHPVTPRGALLQVAEESERSSLDVVLNGPSDDPDGLLNFVGGLRRSMAKAGYSDLKEFQKVGLSVRA